ncbi:MAG: FecR family protein [Candidatus Muiribacteriota bacterium]
MKKSVLFLIFLMGIVSFTHAALEVESAVISYVYGIVKVQRIDSDEWIDAKQKMELNIGDTIKTGRRSKVEINISDKKIVSLSATTKMELPEVIENQSGIIKALRLFFGFIYVNGKEIEDELNVHTPQAVCGIRGTRFTLQVTGPREILTVLAGRVHYGTADQRVSRLVERGEQISVNTKKEADTDQEIIDVQERNINPEREENRVIKEIRRRGESQRIESGDDDDVDVENRPTETSTSTPSDATGSLHINW